MCRSAIIGLVFVIFSCETAIPVKSYENLCDVENPVEDLPWLQEVVASFEDSRDTHHFIEQCEYDGKTYFIVNDCMDINYIPAYDCDGNEVCSQSEFSNCPVVSEKLIPKKIIWQPSYSDCR